MTVLAICRSSHISGFAQDTADGPMKRLTDTSIERAARAKRVVFTVEAQATDHPTFDQLKSGHTILYMPKVRGRTLLMGSTSLRVFDDDSPEPRAYRALSKAIGRILRSPVRARAVEGDASAVYPGVRCSQAA